MESKRVNQANGTTSRRGERTGLWFAAVLVLGVLCLTCGWAGFAVPTAILLATVTCAGAVFLSRLFNQLIYGDRLDPMYCTLIGMFLRMALPLSLCMALAIRRSTLMDTGFAYYIIASYLFVLSLDVGITLAQIRNKFAS